MFSLNERIMQGSEQPQQNAAEARLACIHPIKVNGLLGSEDCRYAMATWLTGGHGTRRFESPRFPSVNKERS